MSVKKVPSNIQWNHHPPQIPFDSVLLYISAGTKIYNYEHVTALSPWYFSGTHVTSLGLIGRGSIILYQVDFHN